MYTPPDKHSRYSMVTNGSWRTIGSVLIVVSLGWFDLAAQTISYDTTQYNGLSYRLVGPYRGGRPAAVTGVAGKPMKAYFGAAGGGV